MPLWNGIPLNILNIYGKEPNFDVIQCVFFSDESIFLKITYLSRPILLRNMFVKFKSTFSIYISPQKF